MLQKIENVLKEFVMGALWTLVQQPGANVIKNCPQFKEFCNKLERLRLTRFSNIFLKTF